MPYVYAFDHKHRRPPMDMKDLLGGKGANLAEMTSVLGLPVPAGFTITTDACRAYMARRLAGGLDARDRQAPRRAREEDGPHARRRRSTRCSSACAPGAKFSMPGMMDTVLNLGLNDESVEGPRQRRPTTSASPTTPTAASSRCTAASCSTSTANDFDEPLETAKAVGRRRRPTPRSRAETLRRLCERYKDVVARQTGKPFPQDPIDAAARRDRGGVPQLERRAGHRLPRARAHQPRPRHRGQRAGDGVRQPRRQLAAPASASPATRPPARTSRTATSSSTRRAKTSWPASATPKTSTRWRSTSRRSTSELLAIFARLERHYRDMCDTEFTIEQGKLWMLQTRVGKRTGAAALRMAVEMTKQKRRWKITKDEALLRVTADHLDQVLHPQFAGERPDRSSPRASRRRRAPPSAARTSPPTTRPTPPTAARRSILVRNETSPEDVHGMQVAEGILTARGGLVSHAAVVARGWGIPAVVGAEAVKIDGKTVHRRRRRRAARATSSRSTARPARSSSARSRSRDAEPPPEFDDDPRLGRRDPQGQARRCGPTPTTAPTPRTPATSAPRASACAAPSTCSSARTACPSCAAMILADDARGGDRRARGAARGAEGRLRGDPRGDGRPARHRAPARPAAARVPAPTSTSSRSRRPPVGLDAEEEDAPATRRAAWHEFNPMLGTRGVRLGVVKPGPLRHAGAGADGGRGRRASPRAASRSSRS